MAKQQADLVIEIFTDLPQQELWDTEEKLRQVVGVKEVDLQESKGLESLDPVMVAAAFYIALDVVNGSLQVTQRIKNMAKILYDLTRSADNTKQRKVLIKNKAGTKIELYGYSAEEIEKFLSDE